MVTWQAELSWQSQGYECHSVGAVLSLLLSPYYRAAPIVASSPAVLALSGWGYAELRLNGVLRSS